MYIISNRQMEEIVKYVEAYRRSVDVQRTDTRTFNAVRLAGILLKRLRAKQPFSKSDLSEGIKGFIQPDK